MMELLVVICQIDDKPLDILYAPSRIYLDMPPLAFRATRS